MGDTNQGTTTNLFVEVFERLRVVDGLHDAVGVRLRRRRHIEVGHEHGRAELRAHVRARATLAVTARTDLTTNTNEDEAREGRTKPLRRGACVTL
jgi:hypothetical protein